MPRYEVRECISSGLSDEEIEFVGGERIADNRINSERSLGAKVTARKISFEWDPSTAQRLRNVARSLRSKS